MKKIFAFLLGLSLTLTSNSQTFNQTWAQRFQQVLDSIVNTQFLMGATAGVLTPEEGIWSGISGNSVAGVPLTEDMRFGIGSNTKLFIAVLMLKLKEEGVLSLDDSLSRWLPKYPNIDSTITIRQLLTHTSGIFNYTEDETFGSLITDDTSHFWTPQEMLVFVDTPYFQPGEGYYYSNTNYLLTGMIIESATGVSWVQELHEKILDPLDMDSTFVGSFENANGPVAGYVYPGTSWWYTYPVTSFFSSAGSAGSIFSTSGEMLQWYDALFRGEVISAASMEQLFDFDPATLYSLGITCNTDATLRYEYNYHTGSIMGYTSIILRDVNTKSDFCFMKNSQFGDFGGAIDALLNVLHYEYPKKTNDAGITYIKTPQDHLCTGTTIPVVALKNYSDMPLSSFRINYSIDNNSPAQYNWSGTLAPNSTDTIILMSVDLINGPHIFKVYSDIPNNKPDEYPYNDTASIHFVTAIQPQTILPYTEGFENVDFPPQNWTLQPETCNQWGRTTTAAHTGEASAVKNNISDSHVDLPYNLDLPLIDLNDISNAQLTFCYAYTYRPLFFKDSLIVYISDDCGLNWDTLFCSGGEELMTAPRTNNVFFPNGSEWDTVVISLAGHQGNVIIRFQNICKFGNNLFLDDIRVGYPLGFEKKTYEESDLKIFPNPATESITCEMPFEGSIMILNINGQQLLEQKINEPSAIVSIRNLPAGIYVAKAVGDKRILVAKFVKK